MAAKTGRLALRTPLWALLALVAIPRVSAAQEPRLPVTKLAADMVWVKNGPKLYGVLLSRDDTGNVRIAVPNDWLAETHREFHATVTERNREALRGSQRILRERLSEWKSRRPDDVGVQVFVDAELKRLDATGGGPEDAKDAGADKPSPMVHVEILADEVRSAYAQADERRRLMRVALQHGIPRAVTRTPSTLARQLEAAGKDWRNEPLEPLDSLATSVDDARQWAARLAVLEYRKRKALKFQGAGGFVIRTGVGAEDAPVAKVLEKVMRDQLLTQLDELLGRPKRPEEGEWLKTAIAVAEKDGMLGFRVARLDKDLRKGAATVTITFHAKMPEGDWITVYEAKATRDVTMVKKESIEEIATAGEVKEILGLLRGSGLPLAGDSVQNALAFGAATKEAMNEAHLAFVTFLNSLTKRSDGPPLRVTPRRAPAG